MIAMNFENLFSYNLEEHCPNFFVSNKNFIKTNNSDSNYIHLNFKQTIEYLIINYCRLSKSVKFNSFELNFESLND